VDRVEVCISPEAEAELASLSPIDYPDLRGLIEDVVSYDPRPSFRRGRDEDRIYGAHLYDLNVRFRFITETGKVRVEVVSIC
ncbi:MAG: tRNA (N6-threonylcarbamoyladenosine(37)-N6)-methyltransferase TrmO, partial [Marinobacter sp.]